MIQAFDNAAIDYDREFTESHIGRMLRQRVWSYMDRILMGSRKADILELNCGTGEDAVFFARRGHRVTATDSSQEMIRMASQKVGKAGLKASVELETLDIRDVARPLGNNRFDLVFSNFGGLNCLPHDDIITLADDLRNHLRPGCRFVAVVMGKMCLWESFYFLAKTDLRKVFRRNTAESLRVNVSGQEVETWYYDPAAFESFFSEGFRKVKVIPVGFFLPPSYMETAMAKRPGLLNSLGRLETAVSNAGMLSFFSDHYLIDLERR
jgi:SAM-dependent methyltransferase